MKRLGLLINASRRRDVAAYRRIAGFLPMLVSEPLLWKMPPVRLSTILRNNQPVGFISGIGVTALLGKTLDYLDNEEKLRRRKKNQAVLPPIASKIMWLLRPTIRQAKIKNQLPKDANLIEHKVQIGISDAVKQGAQVVVLTGYTGAGAHGQRAITQYRNDHPEDTTILTTGNGLTAAVLFKSAHMALGEMGQKKENVHIALLGAYGSIGRAMAELLAEEGFGTLQLVGPSQEKLGRLLKQLEGKDCPEKPRKIFTVTDCSRLSEADLVIAVSASPRPYVKSKHLKRGATIIEASAPPALEKGIAKRRRDLTVYTGGMLKIEGDWDFGFDFGLPRGWCFACMGEGYVFCQGEDPKLATVTAKIPINSMRAWLAILDENKYGIKIALRS